MANTIKVLAEVKGEVTTFKTLIKHPMETGQREDERSGERIPAHFIQEVAVEHAGRLVFKALWGTGISENPYLSFRFIGAKAGDPIKLSWVDNWGRSDSTITKIIAA